jgi:thioredoxin 2
MSSIAADTSGLIVACSSCDAKNRLHFDRLGETHRCASCKADIPAPGAPVEVDNAALFDSLVGASAMPVVVDYWAPWCGPCRMVAPELEKVAQRNAGKLLVVKVNTDEVPELGDRYSIRSIPTMAVFRGGREVGRTAGARPAAAIEGFIADSLKAA